MPGTRRLLVLLCALIAVSVPAVADDRQELEQSLQSRYRVTVIGKGMMGLGSENAIRRAGGTVALRHAGLWGSFDRRQTAGWAIRGDSCELLTGRKDLELQVGQKFYVTAVSVGSDVVQVGLLTVGTVSSGGQSGRLWATAGFFFDPKVIEQGDMGTIEPELDRWLGLGDGVSAPSAAPASAPAPAPLPQPHAPPSELKLGMTRAQVVEAAGSPLTELSFGSRAWLTYPGFVAVLENDKLVSVDRSQQPPSKISIRSEPAGADIFLDGKFVGNTPATLQLFAGNYNLSLQLQGYAEWKRDLFVISGSDTGIQAKLETAGK